MVSIANKIGQHQQCICVGDEGGHGAVWERVELYADVLDHWLCHWRDPKVRLSSLTFNMNLSKRSSNMLLTRIRPSIWIPACEVSPPSIIHCS